MGREKEIRVKLNEKYALSESPDYSELNRIVKRIDTYMRSSRYVGDLGAPIYVEDSYATDVMFIRKVILEVDYKNTTKPQLKEFYKAQIKDIDKATESYYSYPRSS